LREPIQDWQPFRDTFARDFTERRTVLGLTLSAVAERAGLTMSCLDQLQNGRQLPNTKTIVKLAAVFGVAPDKLLESFRPLMPRNGRQ
jgi:transcriptional regulator with XRE-family HTH domain